MIIEENGQKNAAENLGGDVSPANEPLVLSQPPATEEQHGADILAASKRTVKSNPKAKKTVEKLLKAVIEGKAPKPKKEPKVLDRTAYTFHFYGEEQEYLKKIIAERIAAGISTDASHFIRQAVDFSINFNSQFPQLKNKICFSVPEQKTILLKNGFFE